MKLGKVLAIEVIYPHKPAPMNKRQAAGPALQRLINRYGVQMIAIGNGTASRESGTIRCRTIETNRS